jgi:hypothetical protein
VNTPILIPRRQQTPEGNQRQLEASIKSISGAIEQLKKQIGTGSSTQDISGIKATLAGLSAQVAALQKQVKALQNAETPGVVSDVVAFTAGGAITAFWPVYESADGVASHSISSNTATSSPLLGIAITGAADGESVDVKLSGDLENADWTWTPHELIFVGPAGLTQAPLEAGFLAPIAVATSATSLRIDLHTPLFF